MATHRYTAEQLLHLRESPLVEKPDSLPSIEQWIDQPQEQPQRKARAQNGRPDEPSPMGNFASSRPSLLQTKQTSRSATGDEIVLGPPKMSFTSSRNLSRLAESDDKISPSSATEEPREVESASARSRFFRDKDTERVQTKTGAGPGARDRDSWTAGRGVRGFERDEGRAGLGERERYTARNQRDRNDNYEEPADRRNGSSYKQDQRWSRDGERPNGRTQTSERGWRERERRNERDNDRGRDDKDPEWMDEPAVKEEDQAHTAAEFERWKERMRNSKTQPDEKENVEIPAVEKTPAAVKQAPLVPDTGFDKFFGSWSDNKRAEGVVEPVPTPAKTPAARGKSSRFASIFAPKEEVRQAVETPSSPGGVTPGFNESSEDKEGFQRMLQMLRGTTMAPAGNAPPAAASPMEQSAPKAAGGFFDPAMLERKISSHTHASHKMSQDAPDKRMSNPPRGHFETSSGPDSMATIQSRQRKNELHQQGQAEEPQSIFLDQAAPRQVSTPDARNIQTLLAGQRPSQAPALSKDSEFLLNLIQAKKANGPSSQARAQPDQENFQLFLDQPPKMQTHAPQPRQPPPGFLQDHLFQHREPQGNVDVAQDHNVRQNGQRLPPGFFDDPSIIQHGQHNFPSDSPQRRQSGHPGPPPPGHFPPEAMFMGGQHHPQGPQDRMPVPPPGFPPNLRHPQGFANIPNIPNIFQPPGPQPHHQMPPPHMQGRPSMPPDAPGQGMFGVPPPPGFFGGPPGHAPPGAPPGFGPMHPGMRGLGDGLRSPQEVMTPLGAGPGMGRGFDAFGGLGQQRR